MKSYHVGPKGGLLALIDGNGEVIAELPLLPGAHAMASFSRIAGARLWDASGGKWVTQTGNVQTCKPVGQFESAANPSFRVSPAQRQIADIKRMMARTEALHKRTLKAARAMERAKAAPAPAQLSAPVPLADQPGNGEG